MAKRLGPSTGYLFDAKEEYRRLVWSAFRDYCPTKVFNAHVLLMPSIEGREIEVAREFGFLEDMMHVVDQNPAIVATLKRRFPGIHTYGVTLGRSVERMTEIRCANLDLTGCVSVGGLTALKSIRSCLAPKSIVSITVLRGRERADAWKRLESGKGYDSEIPWVFTREVQQAQVAGSPLTDTDVARVCELFQAICDLQGWTWRPIVSGTYRSTAGHQTMLWCCATLQEDVAHTKGRSLRLHKRSLKERLGRARQCCDQLMRALLVETSDTQAVDIMAQYRVLRSQGVSTREALNKAELATRPPRG